MEKNKIRKVIAWAIYLLLLAGTVCSFIFEHHIIDFFSKVVSPNRVVQYLYGTAVVALMKTVRIVVIAIGINLVLSLLGKIKLFSNKALTITRLILNFVKWAVAIFAFFVILSAWGANATLMLAGAGVLTLIIGLGSQAIVADILAGVFIVFEGDFQVGDIVVVDGWRGEVQAIGIRTTKLIDAGGNVKIVNNSDIRSLVNQTKDLSVAKCYIGITYGTRIEAVENVIKDNLPKIKEKIPAIVEGPYYKGVAELAESSVNLLFMAKCKEPDIYQVQRDLNREIKIVFDDNNIDIPFPQVTISYLKENNSDVSSQEKKKAEKFVEKQKDLSKDIDDKK